MTLTEVMRRVEKVLQDNSPGILTGVAVVGTVTTAVLTGKASIKAALILDEEDERRYRMNDPEMEIKDKIFFTWREYAPPVLSGSVTIFCIIASNRIGTRRAAAMAAAYTLGEKAFQEYRDKVVEKLGEKKEEQVRTEIAQERMIQDRASTTEIIVAGSGKVLCYEQLTGRYFESSMEEIKKAQNDTNYEIIHNTYASLGDFYDRLGLPHTIYSQEVGWTSDRLLEIKFSTVLSDDGRPCLALDFYTEPVRNYNRFG